MEQISPVTMQVIPSNAIVNTSQNCFVIVPSTNGAYKGLHTQGRKSNFITPSWVNDKPACLKIIGRQDDWNPYGAPWTKYNIPNVPSLNDFEDIF